MKAAIIGAGGVGGLLGALLARSGIEVSFMVRERSVRALRERGIRVESPLGAMAIASPRASSHAEDLGTADLVLVAVKAGDVPAVGPTLRPLLSQSTVVFPVQNGVEAPDQLRSALGEHVVGGVCHVISRLESPGHVVHKGRPPEMTLGELAGGVTIRLERLAELLRGAGVLVTLSSNIRGDLWEKLLFVEPLGSIGGVTRASIDVFRQLPETRSLLIAAMREVEAVAKANGVKTSDAAVERAMARVDALPAGATASMHRDIQEGRPSELEWQTGAVVRLGRERHVSVPLHEYLLASLLPQERSARGTSSPSDKGSG